MSTRKSLKPQLNQIRAWVQQGRTDAWIAHQLEVTVQQIDSFKREQGLAPEGPGAAESAADLRDADDALIAAELEAEEALAAEEAEKAAAEAEAAAQAAREAGEAEDGERDAAHDGEPRPATRRRGGRGRGKGYEGTFDHGDEGYGLWLDPSVADDPVYAEHWAGHRPVEITIEEDRIVIRRSSEG